MPGHPLGAKFDSNSVAFRLWAPSAENVEVVLDEGADVRALQRDASGEFSAAVPARPQGLRYRFRVNQGEFFPDPASRFQPDGVHGPSQAIDLSRFPWTDAGWPGRTSDDLVIYELHVGTFSPEGTFDGVTRRLPLLRDLGVTAIELMPVADFAGVRNWGYDGVAMFAPARCYGTPADLQRLVDTAHSLGLAVLLDVVYNHFGPDGNYTGIYSPFYVSATHQTPWGNCLNFDGPESAGVRNFFIQNALHWLGEYHIDGLRLDATHAIVDDGPRHFLAELSETMRATFPNRKITLIAEDYRNANHLLRPPGEHGYGLDAVWADDFHHSMRRLLAGDHDGYYRDYRGTTQELADIMNRGWLYCGQHSAHHNGPLGTDPSGLVSSSFIFCLQNHDQIGNRAFGDRLHHQIDLAAYRAASAVLLLVPQTPLLFMGQEWAAASPFLYFTDHNADLGRQVTEGRRKEFAHFQAFANRDGGEQIPDPQAEDTFLRSRLDWAERDTPPHRGALALYAALLALRRGRNALRAGTRTSFAATAWDDDTLVLRSDGNDGSRLLLVARLRGAGVFRTRNRPSMKLDGATPWRVVLDTEAETFAHDAQPPSVTLDRDGAVQIEFSRPGAVLLQTEFDLTHKA